MTSNHLSAEALGRLVGAAARAAVDARLGTQRPAQTKRMAMTLSNVTKFVGNGKRIVRGLASTAALDRQGDIVDPLGGEWALPVPVLAGHDHAKPIGVVRSAVASREGVTIEAELVEGISAADEAWKLIEAGVLDSFSIGFIGRKGKPIETGTRWTSWELIEVSIVAVPANAGAKFSRKGADGSVRLVNMAGAVRLTR